MTVAPLIDTASLPTHLAMVARRLNIAGVDGSGDTFLHTSYLTEILIKSIATGLLAGVRCGTPTVAHKFEYELVRADGLGIWERVISDFTGQSHAGYLDSELQSTAAWVSKKRTKTDDAWARDVAEKCTTILNFLGMPDTEVPPRLTVRHILSQFVRIRNKTKAHGAVGEDFFEKANPLYVSATATLLQNCPIVRWEWYQLSIRPQKNNVRAVELKGLSPSHVKASESEKLRPRIAGIHFRTHDKGQLFHCGELLRCSRECLSFSIPNGGYTKKGVAEFLDYGTGNVEHVELPAYLQPPAPLPASATEGAAALDVYADALGNLPRRPPRYVDRRRLQDELVERLRDRNHPIITLHGRGGIGKTSLALHVAHELSDAADPKFDYILWLSARDLELKPSGATEVRRAIADIDSVCKAIGRLLGQGETTEDFASLLQDPSKIGSEGILFIFDNFETLDDPRGFHRFLDTHTHIPNKVLITSRERAFKGDYPVEVGGMEYEEAERLLRDEAVVLNIKNLLVDSATRDIFDYTDGHPYVMRVLLGEIAKEGHWVPLKSLVPRRSDLLNVVFERSFNKLTPSGRWAFLCVANWRSVVSELILLVVLGQRELDAEAGLDECVRLALLMRYELKDESFCYGAPELARLFAKKKLDGDPDRLLVHEDLELLREFGPLRAKDAPSTPLGSLIDRFLARCIAEASNLEPDKQTHLDSVVSNIAELWPAAWPKVAHFRRAINSQAKDVGYALRRAVEEQPFSKDAWLARADFARHQGDEATFIAAILSAVDADPSDVQLVRNTAFDLCKYVVDHKLEIEKARRGVYLASLRNHMERIAGELDATGLSRLAWLFLLEEDQEGAWKYANRGLAADATNGHCLSLVERLYNQGYRSPSEDNKGT